MTKPDSDKEFKEAVKKLLNTPPQPKKQPAQGKKKPKSKKSAT